MKILKLFGLFLSIFVLPIIMFGVITYDFKWWTIPVVFGCTMTILLNVFVNMKEEK